jgi:hypothetical protein
MRISCWWQRAAHMRNMEICGALIVAPTISLASDFSPIAGR